MAERVDAGPIVDVEMFVIPPGTGVMRLQEMAFVELARLFWRLAPVLATQREPLAELPIEWSGAKSTSRMYAAMCDIPTDISKEELERRIEVFGAGHYGVDLTVTLHGHKFRYVAPEPQSKLDAPALVPAAKKLPWPDQRHVWRAHIALTILSVIFLASPSSIMVLSR